MKIAAKFLLSAGFLFTLSACSYIEEHVAKTKAEEQVLGDYEQVLNKEFIDMISAEHGRRADYVKFVLKSADIGVQSVKESTPKNYEVLIQLRTFTSKARHTLLEILRPLPTKAANSFNFSNAIELLRKQDPQLKIEIDQTFTVQIRN